MYLSLHWSLKCSPIWEWLVVFTKKNVEFMTQIYLKWEVEKYPWFLVSHSKDLQSCHLLYAAADLHLAFNSVNFLIGASKAAHLCSLCSYVLLSIISGAPKTHLGCSEGLFLEKCRALDNCLPPVPASDGEGRGG